MNGASAKAPAQEPGLANSCRPGLWVNCGTEQPMIPLTGVQYVHACRPDPALVSKFCTNANGQAKVYVFARTAEGFESRYFWMTEKTSISEDPGTGSACANLGGWWLATEGAKPLNARISQGTVINRPNLLSLEVQDGQIRVGGRVGWSNWGRGSCAGDRASLNRRRLLFSSGARLEGCQLWGYVEEIAAKRGVILTYESIRGRSQKFGGIYAERL